MTCSSFHLLVALTCFAIPFLSFCHPLQPPLLSLMLHAYTPHLPLVPPNLHRLLPHLPPHLLHLHPHLLPTEHAASGASLA